MLDPAQFHEKVHDLVVDVFVLLFGAAFCFLGVFLPGFAFAVERFGLGLVFVDLFGIPVVKFQVFHSNQFDSVSQMDQCLQMVRFGLQQFHLLLQNPVPVEVRGIQNPLNVFQGKLQFPEQKDQVQPFQRSVVIEPIAGFGYFCGFQQPDGIVVVQCPDTDMSQLRNFVYGFHGISSC